MVVCLCGCGNFAARRIAQAPNSYPKWLAPEAPVTLAFNQNILAPFTNGHIRIAEPPAKIRYRIIEPGDYDFRWTNRLDEARGELDLTFSAKSTNQLGTNPPALACGTVILLHGYGVDSLSMLPWAYLLAEKGWRCVLVDLRGHGASTSDRVYFGPQELNDLRSLLDHLQRSHQVETPVSLVGHSFGGVLALLWKKEDSRIDKVVAMSPYANLATAVENIRREYARWIPKFFISAGVRNLPALLNVHPCLLNPSCWLDDSLSDVLFISGGADKIATPDQVEKLYELSGHENHLIAIQNAAHETLPYYLDDLAEPVTRWLAGGTGEEIVSRTTSPEEQTH